MSIQTQPRVGDVRALVTSAVLGSVMGLAIGGAYLAGGVATSPAPTPQPTLGGPTGSAALQTPSAAPAKLAEAAPAPVLPLAGAPAPASAKLIKAEAPALRAPERLHFASAVLKAVAAPFHLHAQLDQSRELDCLTQAVYSEARGESSSGQAAVAQVILNRVRHPAFPKSICGVVYQGCQFSFACSGQRHAHVEGAAWDRARRIATRAMDGYVMAEVGNATHFHAARLGSGWGGGLMKVAQIGAHIFYRFAGSRGAPGMFHNDAEPAHPVYAGFAGGSTSGGSAGKILTAVENAVGGAFSPSKVVLPTPVSKTVKTADKSDDAPAPAPAKPAEDAPAS